MDFFLLSWKENKKQQQQQQKALFLEKLMPPWLFKHWAKYMSYWGEISCFQQLLIYH